jgi:hypothetical protein
VPRSALEDPQRGHKRNADDSFDPYEAPGAKAQGRGREGKGRDGPGNKGAGKAKQAKGAEALKKMDVKMRYKVMRKSPSAYGLRFKGTDNLNKCHNFQTGTCSTTGCQYSHSCMRCGGNHGAAFCPELGLNR